MKKTLLILVITLLAGCTASVVNQSKKLIGHKLYQDSIDSLASNIRIEQGQNFSVRLYPNGCITSMQPKFLMSPEVESIGVLGGEARYKPKSLNMPYPPKNIQFAEFKIPSEHFIALSAYKSYHTGTELRGCSVEAVYKFASNKNYELLDREGGNQCSLEVHEILSTGERIELKPLKYLRNINEWAGCEVQLQEL